LNVHLHHFSKIKSPKVKEVTKQIQIRIHTSD